uniref:Uncharacterized protein n=1 Tax=Pararge aegeria TaxID=116150 RepID=S4PKM6_9NEOP
MCEGPFCSLLSIVLIFKLVFNYAVLFQRFWIIIGGGIGIIRYSCIFISRLVTINITIYTKDSVSVLIKVRTSWR